MGGLELSVRGGFRGECEGWWRWEVGVRGGGGGRWFRGECEGWWRWEVV